MFPVSVRRHSLFTLYIRNFLHILLLRIYAAKSKPTRGTDTLWAHIIVVGGLISIIGDLGASAIKRNYDIKDYSHLIPGHGGILDRFDSIIFTAPIIYYMLVMVVGLK